jgi:hypothetical protein
VEEGGFVILKEVVREGLTAKGHLSKALKEERKRELELEGVWKECFRHRKKDVSAAQRKREKGEEAEQMIWREKKVIMASNHTLVCSRCQYRVPQLCGLHS